jgi:hypothetical protein
MHRRQILQAFAMGATLKVTGGLADIIGEPGKLVPAPPSASAAPTKTEAWLANLGSFDDRRPPVPACIALGPEADAVIDTLRVRAKASWDAHSHWSGWDSDCFRTGRDDPAGLDRWIETRLRPFDFIALVVDANDPATRAQTPGWADRLAGLKEAALRIAFIVGDKARDPDAPWRAPLHSALDGVFDIGPQRGLLRAAAIATHVDGLLMLSRTLIGYDVADIHAVLKTGVRLRTGATLWSRESCRTGAFRRLWTQLDAGPAGGVLAWLHGGYDSSMSDFNWLCDQLAEHISDESTRLAVIYGHPEWPTGQRVLGLTWVGPGQTSAIHSSRS